MSELKVATFNVEWMVSLFGGKWKDWQEPDIPATFPGGRICGVKLDPISDVPALCERIAGVIRDVDAHIVGLQEAPPLKAQMQVFVERFLNDDYVVHYSNAREQAVCALVRRSVAGDVTAFGLYDVETRLLRSRMPYYPWGKIAAKDQKRHKFHRIPLVLSFCPPGGTELRIIIVHTKSKYSKLKTRKQWDARDPEAILDALDAREALSAEVSCLRRYLDGLLVPPNENRAVVVMGDFNDGPFAELMEREFLVHNIVDELAGSLLVPKCNFRHAMTPAVLAKAATTRFPDPLEGGKIVHELIDHVLVSPGIWRSKAQFRLKSSSCRVETQAYANHDDTGSTRSRGLRPSDHKPVSAIFIY